MSVSVVFAVAGCLALLFGIVGGGIKARELEVPSLSGRARFISSIIGIVLLGLAISPLARDVGTPTAKTNAQPNSPASAGAPAMPVDAAAVTPAGASVQAATETASGKAAAKLYAAKTWNLVLADSFDGNKAEWPMWNADDAQKTETMQIASGVLKWGLQLKTPDHYYVEGAPLASYSDFLVSVSIRRLNADPTINQANSGIYFRAHGFDAYFFKINDLSQYYIGINQDAAWKDLVGWTRSPLIAANQPNVLTVVADGQDLYFYINGTPVETVNDATFSGGNLGLTAGLNSLAADATQFQFDDFELRAKP